MSLTPGTPVGGIEGQMTGGMGEVPRVATLEGFIDSAGACRGVSVLDLEPLAVLHVETRNSVYRIVVSNRTAVFVQGGHFFPEPAAAHLAGSTFGGSLLKIAWIGVGMRMEIWGDNGPILTSPVRRIAIESPHGTRTH